MRLKKMLSMILVVMVVISCFAIGTAQVSAISFTPRLSAPDGSNPYYYDGSYNVYQRYGYGMPNCTAYAFGRAYEILGHEPNLSWYSAENWYGDNIASGAYDYGQTPKVGAIACWTYGYGGHVAVVEDIDDDGNMILSNSAWSGTNFYLTYAHTSDSNPGGNDWWTFQGYIYLIDSAESPKESVKQEDVNEDIEDDDSDDLESINTQLSKVVTDFFINMRSKASVSSNVINVISPNTELNITETKSSDGYTWGKTKYNGGSGWVALDFCSRVDDESTEPSEEQSITPVSNKYKLTDAGAVYLRSSYTTSSSISDVVYKWTELTITETKANDGYTWGKTIYDGVSGWVALDYFTSSDGTPAVQTEDKEIEQKETDSEPSKKPGFYKVEFADYLNMRSDSTLNSDIINCLKNGTELIVTDVKVKDNYSWGKVVYDKKTGWIALDYCELIEKESTNDSEKKVEAVSSNETVEKTTTAATNNEPEVVEETTAPVIEQTTTPETTSPVVEETTTPESTVTVVENKTEEETKPTDNVKTPKTKNKTNIKHIRYCDFNKDGVISVRDISIFDRRLHVFKNQINLNSKGVGYSISNANRGKFLKELISKSIK